MNDQIFLELINRLLKLAKHARHVGLDEGETKYRETLGFLSQVIREYNAISSAKTIIYDMLIMAYIFKEI